MKLLISPALHELLQHPLLKVLVSAQIILLCFTSVRYKSYSDILSSASSLPLPLPLLIPKCDIFEGEWVPDDAAPHYTNETCSHIQDHQNCMKYGRPDLEFMRWRWQPSRCDLPRFDADSFLRLVGNKTLAFVGDSIARNHMQSLLCLLSKAASPKDLSAMGSSDPNRILYYEGYNFTIEMFWSPFLVRAEESADDARVFKLYLDEPDGRWFSAVAGFDYVVLSGANWFTRPSMFYERGQLVGGSYVDSLNITSNMTLRYSHRMAFRTALRAINEHGGERAKVIVRTLSPMSHFEGGSWNEGGDCRRTRPLRSNDEAATMGGLELDLYTAQLQEFREAKAAASRVDMVLMDPTAAMLLRPDGHPSRYGHWPDEMSTRPNALARRDVHAPQRLHTLVSAWTR